MVARSPAFLMSTFSLEANTRDKPGGKYTLKKLLLCKLVSRKAAP